MEHSASLLGVIFAVLMYAISVSPSLLPRRWWWQGFVSGILMTVGYCLGWGLQNLGWFAFEMAQIQVSISPRVAQGITVIGSVLFALWFARSIVRSYRSSLQAAELVQMKPVHLGEYCLGVLATVGMFAVLMAVIFFYLWLCKLLVGLLSRWLIEPLAWLLGIALIILLFLFLSNRVVFRGIMAFFARDAALRNNRTASGVRQPTVSERSGSVQSLCSWSSVGAQGRTFLGRGPNRDQIEAITGQSSMEPVRVYVGLPEGNQDFKAEAQMVVQEMRRTGAFDREVVLISVATGSGWVDEWIVQPMEYLTRGNCATVSMQYSYLFSAAIFLSEMEICRASTRELFWAVRQEIDQMPTESRPLLIISGESLGAEAAQYPFADFEQMAKQVDGAILVGSPNSGPIWRELTRNRHKGSPEVAPVFDSGRRARFVNTPAQLERDIYDRSYGQWEYPRIVFAQHASDPVVWFNGSVCWKEPDWLRERVGLDVSPNMRFTYVATLLQLIADLPMAGTAPGNHGHTYNEELFPVWIKLLDRLESSDWVDTKVAQRINQAIRLDVEGSGHR